MLKALASQSGENIVASKDVTDRNRAEAKLKLAYQEIAQLKEELERERDYLR